MYFLSEQAEDEREGGCEWEMHLELFELIWMIRFKCVK